jgi:hypothetical protein
VFGRKKHTDEKPELEWDTAATQALTQALQQTPVPAVLRSRVKQELKKAAEEHARANGRARVTAEDLMNGMLAILPAGMKVKVEAAMKQGPKGLENLRHNLSQED